MGLPAYCLCEGMAMHIAGNLVAAARMYCIDHMPIPVAAALIDSSLLRG